LDTDVLIVGGGLIGLSIAWELRRKGWRTAVLDRSTPGREASWAGAGMLSPYAESFPSPFWRSEAERALALYPDWVEALARESGVAIDFERSGTLEIRPGRPPELIPQEARVNPRTLLQALLKIQPVEHGVSVDSLRMIPGGVEAAGRSGRRIVIGAGAWSGSIAGLPPSEPVRGHLIGYSMPPASLGPTRRDGHTYILQRANGWTIVGSTEERVGFERSLDRDALRDLAARGGQLWPQLRGKEIEEAWCGFRPATPSGLPADGWHADGRVWLAYGHFRNGILLAPAVAQRAADAISSSLEKD
jgi:glycine/D-amino acid oxidase-like deaminating enzyme